MRVKKQTKCSILWCPRPYYARGFCHTHWNAARRYGSPFGHHQPEYDFINDIIDQTRVLVNAVFYEPGLTRDRMLYNQANKLKKILGSKDG